MYRTHGFFPCVFVLLKIEFQTINIGAFKYTSVIAFKENAVSLGLATKKQPVMALGGDFD